MKANEIISTLINKPDLAESIGTFLYFNDEKGNTNYERLEGYFGEIADTLGTLDDDTEYIYQYSDSLKATFNKVPDAIVVLQDGRCVFLYAIE